MAMPVFPSPKFSLTLEGHLVSYDVKTEPITVSERWTHVSVSHTNATKCMILSWLMSVGKILNEKAPENKKGTGGCTLPRAEPAVNCEDYL